MTAEELWDESGLTGEYEAWAFGGAPVMLEGLVTSGRSAARFAVCSTGGAQPWSPSMFRSALAFGAVVACVFATALHSPPGACLLTS